MPDAPPEVVSVSVFASVFGSASVFVSVVEEVEEEEEEELESLLLVISSGLDFALMGSLTKKYSSYSNPQPIQPPTQLLSIATPTQVSSTSSTHPSSQCADYSPTLS